MVKKDISMLFSTFSFLGVTNLIVLLDLAFSHSVYRQEAISSMEEKAVIGPERCIGCGKCIARVRIILKGFILTWNRDLNSIMPRREA